MSQEDKVNSFNGNGCRDSNDPCFHRLDELPVGWHWHGRRGSGRSRTVVREFFPQNDNWDNALIIHGISPELDGSKPTSQQIRGARRPMTNNLGSVLEEVIWHYDGNGKFKGREVKRLG